jgi:hypothetical protein
VEATYTEAFRTAMKQAREKTAHAQRDAVLPASPEDGKCSEEAAAAKAEVSPRQEETNPDAPACRALPRVITTVATRIAELDAAIRKGARDPKQVKHAERELGMRVQEACVNSDDLDYFSTSCLVSILFHVFNTTRYNAVISTVFPEPRWHQDIAACETPIAVLQEMLKLERGLKSDTLSNEIGGKSRAAWEAEAPSLYVHI